MMSAQTKVELRRLAVRGVAAVGVMATIATDSSVTDEVSERATLGVAITDEAVVVDVLMQYAAPDARRVSLRPSMRADVSQAGALTMTIAAEGIDAEGAVAAARNNDAVASLDVDLDACGDDECVATATVTLSTTAAPAIVDLAVDGVVLPFNIDLLESQTPPLRVELRRRD